jgi:lysyl-tRNA synthetase class 2
MSSEERLRQRARIIRAIRAFFDAQDFIEIDTWVAISAPAPEPHIETPLVTLAVPGGASARYLQPSPEMQMKRVLPKAARIYQIAPVFRQGDLSARHTPEFRLLEWYRCGAPWTQLLDDCEGLLRACAEVAGGTARIDTSRPFLRISMDEAFREHAGFSILEALDDDALRARLRERSIHFAANDSWNDLFHRVFLTHVEPRLARHGQPFFLHSYPAPLQMYSRLSPEDPRESERFEL